MIQVQGMDWDEIDDALARFERAFMAAVARVMERVAEEAGRVRTAATAPEPEPPPPGEPLISMDDLALIATLWAAEVAATAAGAEISGTLLGDLLREFYARSAEITAEAVRSALGASAPPLLLDDDIAREYLATAQNRMVRFADVLWELARDQLVAGFEQGESIEELRDRLVDVIGLSEGRATRVARTEVISASNAGSLTLVEHAGFTGTKSWLSTEDARTRPTHILADGQTVGIDGKFTVGGVDLAFPGDPLGPPEEIINCRCTLTYALDVDETATDEIITEDDLLSLVSGGAMADPQWEAILVVEDTPTGDGRMFSAGALTWEDPPVPLRWQIVDQEGHDGSVIVGNITEFRRVSNAIVARGTLDAEGQYGAEAIRLIRKKMLKGVSIDPDSITSADVDVEYDDEGYSVMTTYRAGRIRSAALVSIPAFVEAQLRLVNMELMEDEMPEFASGGLVTKPGPALVDEVGTEAIIPIRKPDALVASAYVITIPDLPPRHWFEEPPADMMHGAFTVTDQGRVYASIARDGIAHRSYKEKITVPMGNVDYSLFMGGETIVEGGERVVTGVITMDCGHAALGIYDPVAALEHYDNACSVVAHVRVGESADGRVWAAGALVPGLSAERVVRMMGCRLSGDWRPHREKRGWREFAAALLVPVPGFAETRARASVRLEDGELVASSVPVQYVSGEEDCGCRNVAEPAAPDFSVTAEFIARSIGRGLDVRLRELTQAVHGTEN